MFVLLYTYVCGHIVHVCVYAIRAEADEKPVFSYTLLVRMRPKRLCLLVRYSGGCGRIARICVYAICADTDEYTVFAYTLFVRMWTNR